MYEGVRRVGICVGGQGEVWVDVEQGWGFEFVWRRCGMGYVLEFVLVRRMGSGYAPHS